MPKMTVLEMVQDILNDMNSDSVNDITDTEEALQVAQILKTTYYEILGQMDWPHTRKFFRLTASGDTDLPTHMYLPDNVIELDFIKYDKKVDTDTNTQYVEVKYLQPKEFIDHINSRDSTLTTVDEITDPTNIILLIRNDTHPTYWTSFDDETIVFDSYDNTEESTLTTARTQCYGRVEPTFTISSTFTPELPAKAFPFYLAEAKSVALSALRLYGSSKEEQRSRRQRYKLSRSVQRDEGNGIKYPNYGRKK